MRVAVVSMIIRRTKPSTDSKTMIIRSAPATT